MSAEKLTRIPYLKDESLYMLWKYANGDRFINKDLSNFDDFAPINMESSSVPMMFVRTLSDIGIELEEPIFHQDLYLDVQRTRTVNLFEEFLANKINNPKTSSSLRTIFNNKFTFKDIENCLPWLENY